MIKATKDVFNMLDLFYANKHMYDRLKNQDNKKVKEDVKHDK